MGIISMLKTTPFLAIMQHFSDCDGSAIFGIHSKQVAIWINSYQNRTQFDLFQTSSKFEVLTYLGGGPLLTVLGVLSKITDIITLVVQDFVREPLHPRLYQTSGSHTHDRSI
jgi:hypothetical protein